VDSDEEKLNPAELVLPLVEEVELATDDVPELGALDDSSLVFDDRLGVDCWLVTGSPIFGNVLKSLPSIFESDLPFSLGVSGGCFGVASVLAVVGWTNVTDIDVDPPKLSPLNELFEDGTLAIDLNPSLPPKVDLFELLPPLTLSAIGVNGRFLVNDKLDVKLPPGARVDAGVVGVVAKLFNGLPNKEELKLLSTGCRPDTLKADEEDADLTGLFSSFGGDIFSKSDFCAVFAMGCCNLTASDALRWLSSAAFCD